MKYYEQAEQIYRELLAAEPGFENGLLDLAYIFEVTDRPREAEKTYVRILSANPANVQARTRLGNLYMRENKADEAIRQFNQLLKINRKDLGEPAQNRHHPPPAEETSKTP